MAGQSPWERLRQIAQRLRLLPKHPAYKDRLPGPLCRRASRLFDEAVKLGAFAGPEHEVLRELIDRAHHFYPDKCDDIVWMEAVTYLCPHLRELGPVGSIEPACEPIADAIDAEAARLEALEPEAAYRGRARRECFNRAVNKFHGRVTTLAGEIDQQIRQRGIAAVASHPWVLNAFELVNDVVDEVLGFECRAAEYELKSLKVRGACDAASIYSKEQEEKLRHWVSGTLRRFPESILRECHRLCGQPGGLEDLAEKVESEVTYRIRREYSERRAEFHLEIEAAKKMPTSPIGDERRRDENAVQQVITGEGAPKKVAKAVTIGKGEDSYVLKGQVTATPGHFFCRDMTK